VVKRHRKTDGGFMATKKMCCAFKGCDDVLEVDSNELGTEGKTPTKLVGYGMMVIDVGMEENVKRFTAWVCPAHVKTITDELEVTDNG